MSHQNKSKAVLMNILPVYKGSFFFSAKRKDGLKLRPAYGGDHAYTDFVIGAGFQNEADCVENGILFGIMDSLMWYAIIMRTGKICMTRRTTVELITPVPCNAPYRAKGRFLHLDENDFHADAWIEDREGRICARVSALFKQSRNMYARDVIKSLDFSETSTKMRDFFESLPE